MISLADLQRRIESGEIKLVASPTPRSRPYGMAFDPKGTLFVVQFGTNGIAAVDTATTTFTSIVETAGGNYLTALTSAATTETASVASASAITVPTVAMRCERYFSGR